jgi:predicted nucleotide-binding protein
MPQRLRRARAEVEAIINSAVERGEALLAAADDVHDDNGYEEWVHDLGRWHALTKEALLSAYESDEIANEFYESAIGQPILVGPVSNAFLFQRKQKLTRGAINTLESIRERLDYAESPAAAQADAVGVEPAPRPRRVFVVHGHDEGLREAVARVLDMLGFEPIILLEKPQKGRTLIEKFEDGAVDVGFAVVILTPDDLVRDASAGVDEWPNEPNRARQNVILELGYFMGRLGRPFVAALFSPGVDLPSDIHGLGYIEVDERGAWRYSLASELRAAGYDVDTNRL